MAAASAFVEELRQTVAAGFPIVFVVTHEEGRARALLGKAFGPGKVQTWTATTGEPPAQAVQRTGGGVLAMLDAHPFLADPGFVRALRDFVAERAGGMILMISPMAEVPPELDRDVAVLELPLPDAPELRAVLEHVIASRPISTTSPGAASAADHDKEALVRAGLGLSRSEAERAFRMALAARDPGAGIQRVVGEKRRVLRRSSTLELVESEITLDQVGGLEVLKAWLRMRVLAFGDDARAFGLAEPRGMLVCGVQGCGKSLVSKAAARVLGIPLVRLDFADVFSSNAPERALREAMRATEAVSPVVLWVDEIEKGLGGEGSDASQVRVFGAFLTWLQERRAGVFVAATANEVDRLPPELARRGRFDEIFFVDLPSAKEREDILALHLALRGRDPKKYAVADLVKDLDHFSGAELEQAVLGALFRAFAQRRDVTDADLRASAREVVPLAVLYEEKIQALRTWGKTRARRASADRRTLELFGS